MDVVQPSECVLEVLNLCNVALNNRSAGRIMTDAALPTFIAESRELLREMEAALLECEQGESGAEAVNSIFRAAHTIKDSSGLFGLDGIVAFTHVVESVLDRVRANSLQMDRTLGPPSCSNAATISNIWWTQSPTARLTTCSSLTKGEGLLAEAECSCRRTGLGACSRLRSSCGRAGYGHRCAVADHRAISYRGPA